MSAVATPQPAAASRGPGKVVLLVVGALLALLAFRVWRKRLVESP